MMNVDAVMRLESANKMFTPTIPSWKLKINCRRSKYKRWKKGLLKKGH